MKPYIHAKNSARKWGGKPEDYQRIHDFFDQTKAHVPDMRHRAVLHNSFGIFLCEQVFGQTLVNSDGKTLSVRDIAEDHVMEDLGRIPTLVECIETMPIEACTALSVRKHTSHIPMNYENLIIDGGRNVD